jgi:DNA-binding response OmpR family regulator
MQTPCSVLIYGREPLLLKTRKLLLELEGFHVCCTETYTATETQLIREPVDVLVLCYTVEAPELRSILSTARTLKPKIKTLVLTIPTAALEIEDEEYVLEMQKGPDSFIEKVRQLHGLCADCRLYG